MTKGFVETVGPDNRIYLIRDPATGLYWRGSKVRHGIVQRSAWTPAPAKAWHCWQQDQVGRLFQAHFPLTEYPAYEVVPFILVEDEQENQVTP